MPVLAVLRYWKPALAAAAIVAAVFFWQNSNVLRTERDLQAKLKDIAIAANESIERALNEQLRDAGLRAAAQAQRAREAEARAAALSKLRQKVIHVGTTDLAGPGVTAAIVGVRELAGRGD